MLYLNNYSNGLAEIIDMDDLILEYVTRKELNEILRQGIKIDNLDPSIVLKHPRNKMIVSSMLGNRGTSFVQDTDKSPGRIVVSSEGIFNREFTVINQEHNFFIKYNPSPQKRFVLWLGGYVYDIGVFKYDTVLDTGVELLRGIIRANGVDVAVLDFKYIVLYPLECMGYSPSTGCFHIRLAKCVFNIKGDTIRYVSVKEKRQGEVQVGKPMSKAEFQRLVLFN